MADGEGSNAVACYRADSSVRALCQSRFTERWMCTRMAGPLPVTS